MVTKTIPVPSFDLTIFGATGDLSKRKLLPALYHRMLAGQIPRDARIIGTSRSDLTIEEFRNFAIDSLNEFVPSKDLKKDPIDLFLSKLDYVAIDVTGEKGWDALSEKIDMTGDRIHAFYLSISPKLFGTVVDRLVAAGFTGPNSRIVVEKPLGHDLESARALNEQLSAGFEESQIYRIDHYLGKETVQNLMALRFANSLFEPMWNSHHVDHVQITVAEDIGVGGRGEYYDHSGAMRDMVQNHLIQLLCLTAMEPPNQFEADAVRDEKLKVIKALQPITAAEINDVTVRGQYRAGPGIKSYKDDVDNEKSKTESFLALKTNIANWRWSGTPFYLRTGKRLRSRLSEIAVVFKSAPHSIFEPQNEHFRGNALIIRVQPEEAITLRMTIKDPGTGGMRLKEVSLDMTFHDKFDLDDIQMPDAYERLIMDVIRGDQTLFMRGDEVEAAWAWADPIIQAWQDSNQAPAPYDPNTSGPEDALMLMHKDGRRWREISL
jgi:glucose-6-phosphate 1-dehydrogenase